MNKKYELTDETKVINCVTLHRIRAVRSFRNVVAGELGGFIEKEENLNHDGDVWVCDNARVYGDVDYLCFKGLGSVNRNTTFFKCADEHVHVSCGCFRGDLEEFEQTVKKTHGNSKFAREYLACIEVVKIHFEGEKTKDVKNRE